MKSNIASITRSLASLEDMARNMKDTIIANTVMVSEIPAPTFKEDQRIHFVHERFLEAGLQHCSTDEMHNALGIIPGTEGNRNILLVAHADTVFSEKIDHTVSVSSNNITGPSVADNGLGVATLVSLSEILTNFNIQLRSNLVLMCGTRSLGRGNLEGLRFFLSNTEMPIDFGVCIEGVQLGRLSYSSVGMIRGEITCQVPEENNWSKVTDSSAIFTMNEVLNKIIDIPLPKRPRTSIVMGSIDAGHSFNSVATKANLRFEIRSESDEIVEMIRSELEEIVAEVSSQSGIIVEFNEVAQRKPGGIRFSHPLVAAAREIMKTLDIHPTIAPSISELSAFIDKRIPAITVGMTTGENNRELNEAIEIEPIFKGISQLLGVLLAIDGGYCDDN